MNKGQILPMMNKLVLSLATVPSFVWTQAAYSAEPTARPHPPYVAWFQPRFFAQESDPYRHLTLDAGGTVPPERLQQHAAMGLAWAYGINNPDAKGPDYWRDICNPEDRRWAGLGKKPSQVTTRLIRPGVALDEWCNPAHPKSEQWAAEGLRQGREQWPDCFIAVWVTDLTEPLAALVRDGTVDLLILECYTHAPASLGPGPFAQSLPGVYHRVGLVKKAGLLDKAIICLGHITDEPDLKGRRLTPDGLRTLAADLRTRFPECPGIAFYHAHERQTARELIQACDEIGAALLAKP